jgi:DNA processing protein
MDYRRHIIALREHGRVGPKGFQQLLLRFGSPDKILSATAEEIASLPRMSKEKAETILAAEEHLGEADRLLEYLQANNIGVATILDEDYPQLLRQTDDPPPLLYYRGEFQLNNDKVGIALIGTTEASQTGIARAVALGKAIAERGGIVVSGLARGIDAAAHLGALAGQGQTYAVLGCGFDHIYPEDNHALAENMVHNGALISEYPPSIRVSPGQLLARNRIVVGLSQAVILVEEAADSGANSNGAKRALEAGRPVYVSSDSPYASEWQNKGALLIKGIEDLDLVWKYL